MAAAEQLITANLDIWSSAVKAKSAAGRGKSNKLELYGAKKLRELILELAVRGLLVPQDPNDEPASNLLKKIAAEKANLVKDGKIKKPKALPPIEEDEKPFELPDSWRWLRLAESYYSISPSGKKLKTSEIQESGKYPVVDQGQTHISGFSDDKSLVIQIPNPLVVFGDHTRNVKYIDFDFVPGADGTKILCPLVVYPRYFYTYLKHYDLEGRGYARHFKVLNENLIAIPSLEEQNRIVAKVDELMALCDQLEQQQETSITAHQTLVQTLLDALTTASERDGFTAAWARIADHFDTLFTTEWSIDQLKQTILQLAVMGKLVPQDHSDEPASELLKKIAAEKAKLLKDGKIKKQKALPPIEEDEKAFELPEGWVSVRLGDLAQQLNDGNYGESYPKSSELLSEGIPFLTSASILPDGSIDVSNLKYISPEKNSELTKAQIELGDVIFPNRGARGGQLSGSEPLAVIVPDWITEGNINPQLTRIKTLKGSSLNQYLCMNLNSSSFSSQLRDATGGTALAFINLTKTKNFVIGVPPEKEQQKIVSKVDELMTLCATLRTRINTAQNAQFQLADAMAEQAVG